jgi:hypothetical protein
MRRKRSEIDRITSERDALAERTLDFANDVKMIPTRISQRLQHLSDADMSEIVLIVRELFEDQVVDYVH